MSHTENRLNLTRPLPDVEEEYDHFSQHAMRQTIEYNFGEISAQIYRLQNQVDSDAFLSSAENGFLMMARAPTSIYDRTLRSVRTITSSTAAGAADDVMLVDATSGAVTVTLPAAAAGVKELCIKKIDASGNAVTIDGAGSETIDDATTLVLASQYDAVRIMSDGTEWWIL